MIVSNLQKVELLAVLALGLIAISAICPWWGELYESKSSGYSSKIVLTSGPFISSGIFIYYGYGGSASTSGGFSVYSSTPTSALYSCVALFLILAMIFTIVYLYRLVRPRPDILGTKGTMRLSILAMTFLLLGPLALAAGLPGAIRQTALDSTSSYQEPGHPDPSNSFMGAYYDNSSHTNLRWGPDTGWLLAIVGFIALLISMLMYMKELRSAMPSPLATQPVSAPTGPYYQPSPQAPQPPIAPPPQQPGQTERMDHSGFQRPP